MNWELIACIALLYQYGLVSTVIKKIGASEGSRTRKLVWQYFCAALLALFTAVLSGRLELSRLVVIVAVIGAANAFACYCHWRAYDISMSRTAMMSNLDDLIAITLGYVVLGEFQILTPTLTAGVVVSVVTATFFLKIRHSGETDGRSNLFIYWVLSYTLLWGVARFSLRFFYVQGLNMPTFIAAWYIGAWLGALFTRFIIMGNEEAGQPLTRIQRFKVSLLSIMIWTSLMLDFWIRELVPITVIQPIQLVAEMSIPVIIGLLFFGEARQISRKEVIVIAGGFFGVALIAIAF